jgi:hypothetical protein
LYSPFTYSYPIQFVIKVTQCTIVLIRKNIGSIKFILGEAAEPNMG